MLLVLVLLVFVFLVFSIVGVMLRKKKRFRIPRVYYTLENIYSKFTSKSGSNFTIIICGYNTTSSEYIIEKYGSKEQK